ncbi:probable LRR receptor-like serine/threonine-protein kinase At3g47570 isoform X1 [Trifolium pratense]|uniref:probable LRR receptor-like serine/threonine-protein kinase At3g47570 isoform X1 n=1 Tax=Trifolium pratense TaxID=57577 RepID=UPI001E696B0B|nr:probable LRR receptor-like serine/threonine-protein kinase At3g47570 [Trifolium pratense]XP_045829497.1 probable LRR receptor-like serine/threonine-protein kinase At3g47570 isoform X1 [Trifolium pratense]
MRSFMTFHLYFNFHMLVYCIPLATVALSLSSKTDKLALLALKEKLTNGAPDSLPSWNESLHFCDWEGVTCGRRHMRVSVLHLENQTFGGTLGPSVGNLTFLRILQLKNVNLYGKIPSQIGRLKRLQVLNLNDNNLDGEIPMELTNCTAIKVIFLRSNRLSGRIPTWFESMMQLTQLNLGANNLFGTIPSSLGNVSSLQNLSLAQNHLKGSIPYSLGMLSRLKLLILGSNNLSGEIPHSLYNLSNIQVFDLGSNKLLGSLPKNLNVVFPNLIAFLIGYNQKISGTFPSSLSNLTELQMLDISYNAFFGSIPLTLGQLNKLEWFNIGGNNFGSGGAHDLDFFSSLTNCTQLSMIYIFNNSFSGVLPNLIGNFSTHLRLLNMENNKIYGVIPERIGQLFGLTDLEIRNNFLEGTIPDSIGKLKNIVSLGFADNKFSGNIPIVIGNLTMLSELDLSRNKLEGSIPISIRNCTQLQKLSLSSNKLSGYIPNQTFGYLDGLIYLYLYNNSLSGPIPSEFGNLNHLSQLYLSLNKLSGEIPNDLASCISLTQLGLGGNFFHGTIPSFLGSSLRSLEILDLSRNNFSSTIPYELENLTYLHKLDLSFNNLYGEVPMEGVFSNVSAISLARNRNLCGGIPQLKLPPCSKVSTKKHKRSLKKKLIIIISVIGGVLISFIAFLIVYFVTRKPKMLLSSPSLQNGSLRVTYGDLHDATNGFSSSNLVGTGSSGSVYKGHLLHFDRVIAIKVLNLETHGAAKSFMAECKALGKMKHRNLVKIITCCSSADYKGDDFKAIVFEFMSNGSLENLLHNSEDESKNLSLNFTQRVDIALDVANALDYLHHNVEQVVVHCDVKPSNVLLDDTLVAHLGDFGIAKLIHGAMENSSKAQVISSAIKGTIGYVPPEYGAGGQVSPHGDIYSYGILLLEMLTAKRPTDSMFYDNLNLHKFCKMKIPEEILKIVDSSLLMPFSEDQKFVVKNNIKECLVMFAKIGIACSEEFPTQRMIIKDVIMKLLEIKQKLTC